VSTAPSTAASGRLRGSGLNPARLLTPAQVPGSVPISYRGPTPLSCGPVVTAAEAIFGGKRPLGIDLVLRTGLSVGEAIEVQQSPAAANQLVSAIQEAARSRPGCVVAGQSVSNGTFDATRAAAEALGVVATSGPQPLVYSIFVPVGSFILCVTVMAARTTPPSRSGQTPTPDNAIQYELLALARASQSLG
jgi:hypothetical protein